MTVLENEAAVFTAAAGWAADRVRSITRWDKPGMGDWDMRSLVGHTSRSLLTVEGHRQPDDHHVHLVLVGQPGQAADVARDVLGPLDGPQRCGNAHRPDRHADALGAGVDAQRPQTPWRRQRVHLGR